MNHSTLTGRESHCRAQSPTMMFFVRAVTAMLFLLFFIQFNGMAQGGSSPACNISGPLEASANGPDITVNVSIAHSTANPGISYHFSDNTSGASISSQGPIHYNATTNSATQQIKVKPGATVGGGFTLLLTVTTANGDSDCSESVAVSQ